MMIYQRILLPVWLGTAISILFLNLGRGAATIKIRPVSCSNAIGENGTCMFVWQCIKLGGEQLGPCVDRFLVGSCCRIPKEEDNLVPDSSGLDTSSPTKVKPLTSTLPTPTSSIMTSQTLNIGTSKPTLIASSSSSVRPTDHTDHSMMGRSAVEQAVVVNKDAPKEDAAPKEDFSECGISKPKARGKVVGGTHAAFGDWPWQVSVRKNNFFGFASSHRCGGVLLNRYWVATAGHCVDDLKAPNIRIRAGDYDFSTTLEPQPHQDRGVERKVVHPKYNFYTYENDLALLQLEAPVVLNSHIRPICLPPDSATEEALVGVNATVTGWGRLSEGGLLPPKLQEVQIPIVSNAKCKEMFQAAGRHETIPDIFVCSGFEAGGKDACQGDSGGPLQAKGKDGRWFLAGIISWGIGCAEANMPGVSTRITKFKDWILEHIS